MSFNRTLRDLRNFDWNNLTDVESIGVWPGPVKVLLALLVFALCMGLGYWFLIQDLQSQLQRAAQQEIQLLGEYEQKAGMSANLDAYQAQTEEMEASFAQLLRQLPGQTEVPDLVDDVTDTGLGSGLAFSRIELSPEVTHEFYIEQPIRLEVTGNYHELGAFVSGVSSLPRIVTLHDFRIVSAGPANDLVMEVTARTYRYRAQDGIDGD